MKRLTLKGKIYIILGSIVVLVIAFGLFYSKKTSDQAVRLYQNNESKLLYDRNGGVLAVFPNEKSNYAEYERDVPENIKKLLIQKEDRYFYYHPGVNPLSIMRALKDYLHDIPLLASSTITQQLAKNLLGNEFERSIHNKITELWSALSMELWLSKNTILTMYTNTAYFGNNVQGFSMASKLYFNSPPELLSDSQVLQLLNTLSSPTHTNPFTAGNNKKTVQYAETAGITLDSEPKEWSLNEIDAKKESFLQYVKNEDLLELQSIANDCSRTTVDAKLTARIREIMRRDTATLAAKGGTHAAVVVIDTHNNALLSMVGSPRPDSQLEGDQINMALQSRPIGSTIKPFIYLNAFEKGARPYTIVDDREYRYLIDSGYALYPKNYDYQYRGPVTLHYALSNSLNVPAVKLLEYVGVDQFNHFLVDDLTFTPIQNIETYRLGIALGGLESDLLTLSYYFTALAHGGELEPLSVCDNPLAQFSAQTNFLQRKTIANEAYVQLVNAILTDRKTGVEQFGLKNNLIIPNASIAVKTGTSRAYHDSWTVGYTPDFLVGVWVGNAENGPMENVSGEAGAGKIWNEVTSLLVGSDYDRHTPFANDKITEFRSNNTLELGLADDDHDYVQQLLTDNHIINEPHDGDVFLLVPNTRIPLNAETNVDWYINDVFLEQRAQALFSPTSPGQFTITAHSEEGKEETLTITVKE